MVIGYGRVSTDKQDEQSQKHIVNAYAASTGLKIDRWVGETISSTKARKERELEAVLSGLKAGDCLVVSEPSRLARGGMVELAGVVDRVKQLKARLIIVNGVGNEPMIFDSGKKTNVASEMALAVIGWAANMERTNIGERTKAALAARKKAGVKLGRPKGTKLEPEQVKAVAEFMALGLPVATVARLAGLTRSRLNRYLKQENKKG